MKAIKGRRWLAVGGLLAVSLFVQAAPLRAAGRTVASRFDQSGLRGSEVAEVQPVTTGVGIAVVAAVPGTRDAWAIGHSTAKVTSWPGAKTGGQIVFLHYRPRTGWIMTGPPIDQSGRPQNPSLTALSIGADGTGWAVGAAGAMARLRSGEWVMADAPTSASLVAVSVHDADDGFAAGDGPTILRLSGGQWRPEPVNVPSGQTWNILAISTAGSSGGWAAGNSGGATLVLRRVNGSWQQVLTNQPLFDTREQRQTNDVVVSSTVAHAVSATPSGAWVGGTIAPVNVGSSFGDPAGDATRPFTLFIDSGGPVTSFCPDEYSVGPDGKAATAAWCDKSFPLAGFGIVALQAFPGPKGGEAFAGGLGFFHYRDGAWFREPNSVGYVSSFTLADPREGWLATAGGAVGIAASESSVTTLGHWTTTPEPSHAARWPAPATDVSNGRPDALEAVAVDPDGSHRAVAVGQTGASLTFNPEAQAWDSLSRAVPYALHAVAWPKGGNPWAVGGHGVLLTMVGSRWVDDVASQQLTTASLYGVAFTSPRRGYAVGGSGTILRYDGVRWTKDPASLALTDSDIFAVAAAGDEFVAVGADGTMLETKGSTWSLVKDVAELLGRGGLQPSLYAVAGLPDGTALVGGESSTLIRRDGAHGAWRVDQNGSRVPPEGTVLALAARGSGLGMRILASVTMDPLKYAGEIPGAVGGVILEGTADGWRDLDHSAYLTTYPSFDASSIHDAVFGFSYDGDNVWAVGGTGVGNNDGQGHTQSFQTNTIQRVAPNGDPRPPANSTTPALDRSERVVRFAFFGSASCGRGICGAALGSGTKADVIASQIRDEINTMSSLSGGPTFAVFGGDMRATGIPEELGQFNKYLDGFRVPVFAAPGPHDFFSGLTPPAVAAPNAVPSNNLVNPSVAGDNRFWIDTFKNRPAPWGESRAPGGFVPVSATAATGARTHYAFDYAPSGKSLLRVIVVDDVGSNAQTATSQNPPEDQNSWLSSALGTAKASAIPSIVVMNRPLANPLDPINGQHPPASAILGTAEVGSSAIFTSFFRENGVAIVKVPNVATTVPVYTFGGAGAPLENKPPNPTIGYYHSWQLVTVYLDRVNVAGQSQVAVNSYPVVDTLAIHAIDGVRAPAGSTLRFTASGHAPEGGGPGDPVQSLASVVPMDATSRGTCPLDPLDKNIPKCSATGSVGPSFTFVSENPKVGYFVLPDPIIAERPYINPLTNAPVPDATSGLFCAVSPGTTYVDVVSGFHKARMQVSVDGGSGPCGRAPSIPIISPLVPHLALGVPDTPLVQTHANPPQTHHPVFDNSPVALLAVPPVPVVAPAPPAAGSYARKEKHEPVHEESGQNHFVAIHHAHRHQTDPTFAFAGIAAFLGLLGAAVVGVAREKAPRTAGVVVELPIGTRA